MKNVVAVSPFHCRMWDMHDRMEMNVNEETCRAEIDSFQKHGQLIPALGRPLHQDPAYKVELVYGARRLFVARHLNAPLLVELREMSDQEAIVAMDIENRHRSDLSAYERGISYARWLRSGLFQSQDDIARALRVSASQVSRLLKLAQLPPVIVEAFATPGDLCEGWGLELMQALDDPARKAATIRTARHIGAIKPRPSARDVYRELLNAATRGRRAKSRTHDEVVKDGQGRPLFRIRHQSGSVAFVMPLGKVAPETLDHLKRAVSQVLEAGDDCFERLSA